MAKQSGIGASLFVDSVDVSGDIGAISQIEASVATQDVPAINESAMDRLILRRDGAMAFNAFWDTTEGAAHAALSALPRTDRMASIFIGSTLGYPAASMIAKQIGYAPTLGEDGSLGAAVSCQANGYGLEWGEMLTTGQQTFATGTVDGTAIDLGATSTLFGAAAYLHVFSHGSGTATFVVQDSDDNLSFSTVTGLSFTAVTGATTERKQTAAGVTVRQYVRIHKTGVSTATVAAVNFVRYTEAGPI